MQLYSDVHDMPLHACAEHEIPGLRVVGANAGHAVHIQAAEVGNAALVDCRARHAWSAVPSHT